MRRSRLDDPSGAYPKVLASISMALGCLGWDNDLVDVYGVAVLY
jgi:hypothetical protein